MCLPFMASMTWAKRFEGKLWAELCSPCHSLDLRGR